MGARSVEKGNMNGYNEGPGGSLDKGIGIMRAKAYCIGLLPLSF